MEFEAFIESREYDISKYPFLMNELKACWEAALKPPPSPVDEVEMMLKSTLKADLPDTLDVNLLNFKIGYANSIISSLRVDAALMYLIANNNLTVAECLRHFEAYFGKQVTELICNLRIKNGMGNRWVITPEKKLKLSKYYSERYLSVFAKYLDDQTFNLRGKTVTLDDVRRVIAHGKSQWKFNRNHHMSNYLSYILKVSDREARDLMRDSARV